jgi:hypothetical protein
LRKFLISKSFEASDEKTDEDKRMMRIIDLNDMAFTEVVISIEKEAVAVKYHLESSKAAKRRL